MFVRRAVRAGVTAGWLLAAVAFGAYAQAASEPRILRAEPLRALTADRDAILRKSGPGQLRELKFDAFGRRFSLMLDANAPLTAQLEGKTSGSSVHLYRGRLADVAGSWVRIAAKGDTLQGMLWDGVDLYAIEPARDAAGDSASRGEPSGMIIFRLADVVIDASDAACAAEPETGDAAGGERRASDQYESLLAELKGAPTVMRAAGAHLRLQISAMGDASFLQRYASQAEARDAILVRLNNVDGIFSAQLGVEIQVPAVFVNAAPSDPLSDASSPNALLQELASLRKRSFHLNQAGLTHLFTGRDLNGETVGIAYLNRLCHTEYGVGLTEVRGQAAWRDSLIAAHEIGHNFGANHDGDSAGSCPSTPTGMYLMSSTVSGNDRFSQCSVNVMRPRVEAAACVVELSDADPAVAADLGVRRTGVAKPLEWRLEVANVGGVVAERVRTEILVPPVVRIEDAYVAGGSCTSGAGAILCQLGDVPGGAARAVNVTLRSDEIGTSSVSMRVASDNDAVLANNRGSGELDVRQEADLELTLAGPASAIVGAELQLTFSASNRTPAAASDVNVQFDVPDGLSAVQASVTGGACTIASSRRVDCSIASAPGEATLSGALKLISAFPGPQVVQAAVSGAYFDPQPSNDASQHAIKIEPATAAASQNAAAGGGRTNGGGGGASSWMLLLALAGLRLLRR